MEPPRADRPFMPGYGLLGPTEGTGLLSWRWAHDRLVAFSPCWSSVIAAHRPWIAGPNTGEIASLYPTA